MSGRVGSITTGIISDGLALHLDAANRASYPKTGTTWFDTISANNGTIENGAVFDDDVGGNFDFDGSNDYVETNYNLPASTTKFSTSLWIRPHDTSTAQILIDNRDAGADGYNVFITGNTIRFRINGTDLISNSISGRVNTWFNVTTTYDGTLKRIFFNGVIDDGTSQTATLNVSNLTRLGTISQSSPTANFNGQIASAQIYERALSKPEVLHNYNALKGRFGL